MQMITRQLKHWLSSKMPALNYSITHCIRHSCSYCTANGWLEDHDRGSRRGFTPYYYDHEILAEKAQYDL